MKKRILSIAISLVMLAAVIAAQITPAGAATNTVNKFKQGQLLKCGNYLFASALATSGTSYKLFRMNTSGKAVKKISSGLSNNLLCSYKNSVFYQTGSGIYSYSAKTLKSKKICKKGYKMVGICSKGIICDKAENIYLVNFNKKIKKILSNKNSDNTAFLGASSKYVYSTKVLPGSDSPVDVGIYRYDIKTGKSKKTSTVTIYREYASSRSYAAVDFHTFKNYVVFSLGYYEGSMNNYVGDIYRMNINGTDVQKLENCKSAGDKLTPGKGCVYATGADESNNARYYLKITSDGQLTRVYNSSYGDTTANNKMVYNDDGSVYVSDISGGNKKCVLKKSKLIKLSYPSDAQSMPDVIGEYGSMALVNCKVITYQTPGSGWRGSVVNRTAYLINTKTNKAIKIG